MAAFALETRCGLGARQRAPVVRHEAIRSEMVDRDKLGVADLGVACRRLCGRSDIRFTMVAGPWVLRANVGSKTAPVPPVRSSRLTRDYTCSSAAQLNALLVAKSTLGHEMHVQPSPTSLSYCNCSDLLRTTRMRAHSGRTNLPYG
jgi:hypothetical protein